MYEHECVDKAGIGDGDMRIPELMLARCIMNHLLPNNDGKKCRAVVLANETMTKCRSLHPSMHSRNMSDVKHRRRRRSVLLNAQLVVRGVEHDIALAWRRKASAKLDRHRLIATQRCTLEIFIIIIGIIIIIVVGGVEIDFVVVVCAVVAFATTTTISSTTTATVSTATTVDTATTAALGER